MAQPTAVPTETKLLIIGYGNTLRRDDGVGPRLVERLSTLYCPGVEWVACHQLVPELAERISRAGAVVFADAISGPSTAVALEELSPAEVSRIFVHAADPRSLLAMAGELFGKCPRAWVLNIPVEDLSFGEGFSAKAEAGLKRAVEVVRQAICDLAPASRTSKDPKS